MGQEGPLVLSVFLWGRLPEGRRRRRLRPGLSEADSPDLRFGLGSAEVFWAGFGFGWGLPGLLGRRDLGGRWTFLGAGT